MLSTYVVTSVSGDASLPGTLPYAVAKANVATTPTSIEIELGTSSTTIPLEGTLDLNGSSPVTIYNGPGQGPVTVSGNDDIQVLNVGSKSAATITGLTLSHGSITSTGGAVYNSGKLTLNDCTITGNTAHFGGGLYNASKGGLELNNCTISNNLAEFGGGLENAGQATLSDITFSGNSASNSGGGLENFAAGILSLTNSKIQNNNAAVNGGGLYGAGGTSKVANCTISGNTATKFGGGVYVAANGSIAISSTTISNNSAEFGGGLENAGIATLTACSIAGNSTSSSGAGLEDFADSLALSECTITGNVSGKSGGGLYTRNSSASATILASTISGNTATVAGAGVYDYDGSVGLTDTIVAGNSAGTAGDIGGPHDSAVIGTHNLIGTGGSGGLQANNHNLIGANPDLAPLGSYGGPTQTMALLPGSPAIGVGLALNGISNDERGEPIGTTVDLGAFQSQGFTLTPVSGSTPQSTTIGTAFNTPLTVLVQPNNPNEPVAGGVITFNSPTTPGASASLSNTTAVIGSNGLASITATANQTEGSYKVTASADVADPSADFELMNQFVPINFSNMNTPSITYGTSTLTLNGTLADGSLIPTGEIVTILLDGQQQMPKIGENGSFSATFDTAGLTVTGSPYSISYQYPSDGKFNSASANGSLTVTKAFVTPVITASAKVYDGTLTATLTSETLSGVIGQDSVSLTGGVATFASKDVGSDITVTDVGLGLSGSAAGNYQLASTTATSTANITPAPLSVSGITADNKVYDGTTTATLNLSKPTLIGLKGNDQVTLDTSEATGSFASANVGNNITVAISGLGINGAQASDYTLTQPTITASITPATPTITWSAPSNLVYGQALSSAQLDATANVPGTLTYSPAAGSVPKAGNDTLSVTFTPTNTTDYTTATANVSIVVAKATPSLTVSDPGGTQNGSAFAATALLSGLSGLPSSSLEGVGITLTYYAGDTPSGTPLATAPSAAGTYTVVASFAGSPDYAATETSTQFTIKSPPPTIVSAQVLTAGKKAHQRPIGIELLFSQALEAVTATNPANYLLTQSVKHGHQTVASPLKIRVEYTPGSDDVSLLFSGSAPLTKGGQLTVIAIPPTGITSAAGVALDGGNQGVPGNNAIFTILPKARGIVR